MKLANKKQFGRILLSSWIRYHFITCQHGKLLLKYPSRVWNITPSWLTKRFTLESRLDWSGVLSSEVWEHSEVVRIHSWSVSDMNQLSCVPEVVEVLKRSLRNLENPFGALGAEICELYERHHAKVSEAGRSSHGPVQRFVFFCKGTDDGTDISSL